MGDLRRPGPETRHRIETAVRSQRERETIMCCDGFPHVKDDKFVGSLGAQVQPRAQTAFRAPDERQHRKETASQFVTSAFDPKDRNSIDGVDDDMGYEVGVAVMPVEGVTAKAFYIADEDSDTDIVNVWASYVVAGFTFAGEYNTVDYGSKSINVDGDGDGFLLMANYATGPFGFTVRYHDFEIETAGGATADDGSAITLSPSYKVGSNLLLVAEYRMDESDTNGDSDSYAIEALFTF